MKILSFKKTRQFIKDKKKALVICGMALLLVITGVLNYKLNTTHPATETANTSNASASFFDTYKEDRTKSRESQIELLDEIINSSYATASEKSTAIESKMALQKKMETELILEGLIKAKGYQDAVVTIGSEYYNVIVKGAELTSEQATQILGVIMSETKTDATNVKIIPVE